MVELATLKVDGMADDNDRLKVINALRKYSGVLDVDVDQASKQIRVEYDPSNIIAKDLKSAIQEKGYKTEIIFPQ